LKLNRLKFRTVKQEVESKARIPNESYHQILKSTTIIGASSAINIIFRIIRIKFLAILLGPSGIGLLGIYNSITDMAGTIARLGIDSSGVRQIAQAVDTGNEEKTAHTVFTLRRVSLILGVSGTILVILLSSPICYLTFKNTEYASEVILLSVIVLLETVISGEVALIQGMRKIGDLAKINVFSALFGTILSIPIIYVWGQKGIVPFLIAASTMNILTTSWYAKKIKVPRVQMGWVEIRTEVKPLLRLGSVIMASTLMYTSAMWLLSVLVARRLGLEGVGLYQAAMTFSSIYVGFILNSMIKDYFPRLTAIANDDAACNELVNQQAEIGILLAMPGILATLTFAPIIIQIFYTAKFVAAFEILRWQILGTLLQVTNCPMGLVLQAKLREKQILLIEFLRNVVHVGLIWAGISYFGLNGTGMAYFGMHVFYWIIVYGVVKHLTGFTWSKANTRIAVLILPGIGIVFVSRLFLDNFWCVILGSTISAAMTVYSVKYLVGIISPDGFVSFFVKIKDRFSDGIFFNKDGKKSDRPRMTFRDI
jgi:antigen flippase